MKIALTSQQLAKQTEFRTFTDTWILPYADQYHREERTPADIIERIAQQGYLGAIISSEWGGGSMDMISYGLLLAEVGRGCSSLRSLLTVQSMVASALLKWGNKTQREYWLPRMASGESIAAFGLSEINVGSDAKNVETTAVVQGNNYVLNGQKSWITYGQIADVFLIFAQLDGQPVAFLVERNRPGVSIHPITGLLGVKASMLAEIHLSCCTIPQENLIGRVGFGFSHVAATALHIGRYSVAWGCVGIAQACLEASVSYAATRKQFGVFLQEHQLVRRLITQMLTNTQAARLLCYRAGYLQDSADPNSIPETSLAKYFASTIAVQAANDAIQIHGAHGCSSASPVQRYLGDAKVMEIIEGSTQIQEITLATFAYQFTNEKH